MRAAAGGLGGALPNIESGSCDHQAAASSRQPADRQTSLAFPPLSRADVDAQVVGDLFPGYEFLAHGTRHDGHYHTPRRTRCPQLQ